MRKVISSIIAITLILCNCAFAEESYWSYEARQKRLAKKIKEEIEHNRRMEELELQHEIYCKELELQKDNISIIQDSSTNVTNIKKKNDQD